MINLSKASSFRSAFLVGAIAAICLFGSNSRSTVIIYQDFFTGRGRRFGDENSLIISTTGAKLDNGLVVGANGGGSTTWCCSDFQCRWYNSRQRRGIKLRSHDAGSGVASRYACSRYTVYTLSSTFTNDNPSWVATGFASSTAQLDGAWTTLQTATLAFLAVTLGHCLETALLTTTNSCSMD